MEKEANKSRIYCTYMIEVEIAFVAAQVILLLVSNKGLFFVAVPCVCPNEAAMNRKERERKYKINTNLDSADNPICALYETFHASLIFASFFSPIGFFRLSHGHHFGAKLTRGHYIQ